MNLKLAIDEFLVERELAPTSQLWYTQKLNAFSAWTEQAGITNTEQLEWAQIRQYTDYLRVTPSPLDGRTITTQTLHGYLRAIRAFVRWALQEDMVDAKVALKFKMPKVEEKVLGIFTPEQINLLIQHAARAEYPWLGARGQALLALLADTGIRANEACTLTLDNCFLVGNEPYARVRGKGNKWREVGLGKRSRQLLYKYIHRYRPKSEEPYVFISKKGRGPMTPQTIDKLLYRLRDSIGIVGVRCSAHTFRHTYAFQYLAGGGDIFRLQRLLGHTDIKTTQNYLRAFSSRDARRGYMSVLDNL